MITASIMKELKVAPNTLRKQPRMEPATEKDPHSWWEKTCLNTWSNSRKKAVKNFLYTVYSFYLVLLFLLLLLNCTPYGTETYLRLPQTTDYYRLLFVTNVNGFRLTVLDLLQLSCLFSLTLIFSKSSSILVSITE